MGRKRYSTEQIIGMLREAEVKLSQGEAVGVICRGLGISEQSYYRWRRVYDGLKLDQAKKLKDRTISRSLSKEATSRGKRCRK
jgi:transposase-like protein